MNDTPGVVILTVTGMVCDGCAAAVTRALTRQQGVTAVTVDRAGERATVAGTAAAAALVEAVTAAGFGAST